MIQCRLSQLRRHRAPIGDVDRVRERVLPCGHGRLFGDVLGPNRDQDTPCQRRRHQSLVDNVPKARRCIQGEARMGLKDKRCVPCEGGTPPLDDVTTRKLLGQVSGWAMAVRSGTAAPAQALRFRRLPGRDGVRRQGGRGGGGGGAPSRLLRPLQPRRRHAVDSRRRAACPKTTSYSPPRSTVSWRDAGRSRDHRRDRSTRDGAGRVVRARRHSRVGAGARHRPRRRSLPSAKLHAWDATRGSPPAAAFEGVDVVVNLMGENRSSTIAGAKRARSSCVTAASSARARSSTPFAICPSARGC